MPSASTRAFEFSARSVVLAFVAGFLSVLVFQYGLAALLYAAGLAPNAPYSMKPVAPFGVPQTFSSAFWGGIWGLAFLPVLRGAGAGADYWVRAALFGGLIVSAVLLFIVLPLKGRPLAAGWNMRTWATIFCLHAAFGLGTAFFLRVLGRLNR